MLKRIVVLTSVLAVVTVLTGCGKQTENSAPNELQMQNRETSVQGSTGGQKGGAGGQAGDRGAGRGAGMSPTQAKEACAEKTEGDVCQFTLNSEDQGDMEISGTCNVPRQQTNMTQAEAQTGTQIETDLSCRPDSSNMPNRGNNVAPVETNIGE